MGNSKGVTVSLPVPEAVRTPDHRFHLRGGALGKRREKVPKIRHPVRWNLQREEVLSPLHLT